MTIKVENGIPLHRRSPIKRDGDFHDFLRFCQSSKVGQSVVVSKDASNYRMAMLIAKVWLKRTFTASPQKTGGTRIWRVE